MSPLSFILPPLFSQMFSSLIVRKPFFPREYISWFCALPPSLFPLGSGYLVGLWDGRERHHETPAEEPQNRQAGQRTPHQHGLRTDRFVLLWPISLPLLIHCKKASGSKDTTNLRCKEHWILIFIRCSDISYSPWSCLGVLVRGKQIQRWAQARERVHQFPLIVMTFRANWERRVQLSPTSSWTCFPRWSFAWMHVFYLWFYRFGNSGNQRLSQFRKAVK